MDFLRNRFCAGARPLFVTFCALAFAVVTVVPVLAAGAAPTGRTLRFLSLAIRDKPPSLSEVKAHLDQSKTLEASIDDWLKSPEHKDRIRRYFTDMMGFYSATGAFDSFFLKKDKKSGVYHLPSRPRCEAADALAKPAWWLEANQTFLICPTSTSDAFRFGADREIRCDGSVALDEDARCGCGPYQLSCIPDDIGIEFDPEMNKEPANRGLNVYENDLTWLDFFGGNFLVGHRSLYLWYMHSHGLLIMGQVTPDAALASLRSIPMKDWVRADFPTGFERAGIVTAPGFLSTYNTAQSRIRALSRILTCKDVDPSMNFAGKLTGFVNPDLTTALKDHGKNPRCSGCHLGMDNQMTALFGFYIDGVATWDAEPQLSQKGHAFGEPGSGPGFLVDRYVNHAPEFHECMAKTAWTSLTALNWDSSLSASDRAAMTLLSKKGPKSLIQGILKSPLLQSSSGK